MYIKKLRKKFQQENLQNASLSVTWDKFAVRFISAREYIEISIAIVETPKSLIKRVDGFKLLIRKFASRATRRETYSRRISRG